MSRRTKGQRTGSAAGGSGFGASRASDLLGRERQVYL